MKINNENMVDYIIDSLETAKKAHDVLPPLPPDIKPVHCRILGVIKRIRDDEGNSRVTDINKALGFWLPNTTKFINELVKLKVVEKINPASDKRVVLIHVTKLGEKYIDRYIVRYHAILQKEFSNLSESDCEIMIETINKVSKIIQKVYKEN